MLNISRRNEARERGVESREQGRRTRKKSYLRLTTYDLRLLYLLPLALLFSCTQPNANRTTPGREDKPQVVATSTIINDLAERVGGEEIQLRAILKP